MASPLHEEPSIPTRNAKSFQTVLAALSQSNQTNVDPSALPTAIVVCGAVTWITPEIARSAWRVRDEAESYLIQEKQVLELQSPENRLIIQFRGGLFIYLRLVIEITAAITSHLDSVRFDIQAREAELVEEIDNVALAETLSHYKDLSIDDLWFLVRRAAADARSKKKIYPGRYLSRWRRFVTDILRTRNCEARVRMALREKALPQELRIMIFQSLLDLEELPPESSWEVLWSTRKKPEFRSDTSSYLDLDAIEGVSQSQLREGSVVFDPISRQFAWALDFFGNAIYFGYEPTLLFDPFQDCWTWNKKHLAKFGTFLTSTDFTVSVA